MIKILNEKPITYDIDMDVELVNSWIYENPTDKEAEEILNSTDEVRGLIYEDKYYIADANYFLHPDMAILLKNYTGLSLLGYKSTFDVWDKNIYIRPSSYSKDREQVLKSIVIFKQFLPTLIEKGFVKLESKIHLNAQQDLNGISMKDLLNIDIQKLLDITIRYKYINI